MLYVILTLLYLLFFFFWLANYTKVLQIRRIYNRLKKRTKESLSEKDVNQKSFFKLSPVDNIYNDNKKCNDETINAMDFALDKAQNEIHNIAIMGPYGSGKSSFWHSYKRKKELDGKLPFSNEELLEVSFAKFTERKEDCVKDSFEPSPRVIHVNNYDSSCMDEKEKEEFEIERGILQQVLFSVEKDDIPKSSIQKKYSISLLIRLGMALCSICICFLYLPEFAQLLSSIFTILELKHTHLFIYFLLTAFFITFIVIIYSSIAESLYYLLNKFSSFCLSSISLKGLSNGVDISFDERKGSLINQNIAELIYFFEQTGKKIVVFEDIDRNKTNVIFSKLRELNRILNNCPKLKNKIKFIYMIGDDVLQKYERTKFFDFIIPIVPVLNGDNAADFIKKYFVKDNDTNAPCLSNKYLKKIERYLDDLRLVKNCFNELKIYKDKNKDVLDKNNDEKIFSLILYKNLYPKDFQNLLRQKGLLYYCLNKATQEILELLEKKSAENGGQND